MDKHSFIFPVLYAGFLLLTTFVIRTWPFLSFLRDRLYLLDLYAFGLIYVYKAITDMAEEDLQRLSFQAVALLSLVIFLSADFVLPMALNPLLFLLGNLLGQLPFIIEMSLALFGFIYILYHGHEVGALLRLAPVSIIITASSQVYKFYTNTFFIHFPGPLFMDILLIMLLVIACQKVIQKTFGLESLTPFFIIGGLVLFCLEIISGFLIDYFSGYMGAGYDYVAFLLLNLQTLLQFSLWGLYFLHKTADAAEISIV